MSYVKDCDGVVVLDIVFADVFVKDDDCVIVKVVLVS
jgi:hypothetical protein